MTISEQYHKALEFNDNLIFKKTMRADDFVEDVFADISINCTQWIVQ